MRQVAIWINPSCQISRPMLKIQETIINRINLQIYLLLIQKLLQFPESPKQRGLRLSHLPLQQQEKQMGEIHSSCEMVIQREELGRRWHDVIIILGIYGLGILQPVRVLSVLGQVVLRSFLMKKREMTQLARYCRLKIIVTLILTMQSHAMLLQ